VQGNKQQNWLFPIYWFTQLAVLLSFLFSSHTIYILWSRSYKYPCMQIMQLMFSQTASLICGNWCFHRSDYEKFCLVSYNTCGQLKVNRHFRVTCCLHLLRQSICLLLHVDFLLGLYFYPEDGANTALQNTGWLSTDYTALHPRRQNSSKVLIA
jgi:hypothetical protein